MRDQKFQHWFQWRKHGNPFINSSLLEFVKKKNLTWVCTNVSGCDFLLMQYVRDLLSHWVEEEQGQFHSLDDCKFATVYEVCDYSYNPGCNLCQVMWFPRHCGYWPYWCYGKEEHAWNLTKLTSSQINLEVIHPGKCKNWYMLRKMFH